MNYQGRNSVRLGALLIALAVSNASPTFAGSVQDADSDLVPDPFDNCSFAGNGPNEGSNQGDCDGDGYGNACDADYDQNGIVSATDFGWFLSAFGSVFYGASQDCRDHNEDNAITASDFGLFLSQFGGPPGPSNLTCADPLLIVPPDMECDAQSP